jgi:hypothetical protein
MLKLTGCDATWQPNRAREDAFVGSVKPWVSESSQRRSTTVQISSFWCMQLSVASKSESQSEGSITTIGNIPDLPTITGKVRRITVMPFYEQS